MSGAASASVQDLTPTGGYQLKLVGVVRKKVGRGRYPPEGCRKIPGHTGDVARRADVGVGFTGRGSTAGPLPIT